MSMLDTDEATFFDHDALSCFSDDEWRVLQEWQKELCGNVMKEIHQALISLGPLITSTVLSLRAKGKQQMQQMQSVDRQKSERRPLVNGFQSNSIPNPRERFCNMKGEQNVHLNIPQVREERESHDYLSRDDPATIFIDHLGAEVEESSTKAHSGVPLITAVFSLSTNLEEETCAQEKTEAVKGTSDSRSMFMKEPSTCYERPKNSICPSITDRCQVVQIEKLNLFTDGKNTFKREKNYLHNQRYRSRKKAFTCSDCWRSFAQKSDLNRHQRIHTGEKPYSCNQCEKRFTQQPGLKRHQRFHSGEKPFPCTECEKSFVYRSDFERHQRIHKPEKMYNCTVCEKSFTLMSTLHRHQRIHNDQKSFSCTDCKESFLRKSDFLHHQRMHTG
ncbi:uncharacterized protein LOC144792915 isoform X2 [Lissotriton helveticus]